MTLDDGYEKEGPEFHLTQKMKRSEYEKMMNERLIERPDYQKEAEKPKKDPLKTINSSRLQELFNKEGGTSVQGDHGRFDSYVMKKEIRFYNISL